MAELKTAVERGDYQALRKTFDELAVEYLGSVLKGKSAQSQRRYEGIVRLHLLPYFTGRSVGEIPQAEAFKYIQSRNEANIPADSIKKERRVLRDIMRLAVKDFAVPDVLFKNKGRKVTRFLSEADLSAIIGYLEEQYQAIAVVAAFILGSGWGTQSI
ncbi:MAG: hypothetical protein HZA02_08940 [Nitrospinae bacterium]|nr:hypothetical protein [Nitrospinota bacterium]